jgi:hypothetical protein
MEAMRQSWSDDRLDALNGKVDRRFDEVNQRFDRVEGAVKDLRVEMNEMRSELNDRIDGLQRSIVYLAVGLTGGMLAGFGGMATLLATQV